MYKRYVIIIEEMGCSSSHQTQQNVNKKPVQPPVPPPPISPPKQHDPGTEAKQDVSKPLEKTQTPGTGPAADDKATKKGRPATEEEKAEFTKFCEEQKQKAKELEDQIRQMMAMLEKTGAGSPSSQALIGNVNMEYPSSSKIVRIFTSSTFTDTKQERNMLMKVAYPKIKEHCRKVGYEFQVVDMRWGIRDEATDDHMTTELCLKELKLCQKLSTGPNFVSLLSHKYGYTPFPRVIEAVDFEKIFDNIEEPNTKDLFQKWFTRDDNSVPPAYILSSVSTHIPDFLSNDKDKQKVAKDQWWEESQEMQEALLETVKKAFDKNKARKYIMSVTETETEEGLKPKGASKHFLWLNRTIEDIEQQESSHALSRFMECLGPEEKVKRARQMLKELKEDKMQKTLDPDKILNYSVNWSLSGGIDPDGSEEHRKYLESLSNGFVEHMTGMIDKSIAEKEKVNDPLIEECIQHIRFCQSKCEGFAGRKETLEQIKSYLTSTSTPNQPFVLHGTSGTGKTSILAMAAKMAGQWMGRQPMVILRFLGTSPESSDLMSLLYSICSQIRRAYKLRAMPRTQEITYQIADFKLLMLKGRPDLKLLLILDSLDQLDHAYNARQMAWLFTKLNPQTKVILSTLPEPVYQCFPALQASITNVQNFVEVPVLEKSDVRTILDNWLQMRKRKLTDKQMQVILKAFDQCPTPLFLKLSFEESTSWTSFHSVEKTILQTTVRSSIEHLFEKLEKLHGKILVSRALAYLTLTRNGASEAELEDILSCDDDVLNDVYMYWTPPMRRLPPLLLVRIRNDLSQYLVERGADGTRVLYWYHRQFTEAAEARYCSNLEQNKLIHGNLADFFNGTWANGKSKPYTTSKGEKGEDDRHVAAQPLKFGKKEYNVRSLSNLPYHRIRAGQQKLLEQQCLANIHFLLCKLEAMPLIVTIDDFTAARECFPDNELIRMIHESLLLSQKGLVTDPGQVVPQLLGRLEENNVTRDFLKQCRAYPKTFIEPTKRLLDRPGGQLVHCIAAHTSDIDMMDMTRDGSLVLTVCQSDKEISLWDIQAGSLKRKVINKGQSTHAVFCNNDRMIACEKDKVVVIEDVYTGKLCFNVALTSKIANTSICVAGKDKSLLLAFNKQSCLIFDLNKEGQLIQTLIHTEKMKFGALCLPYGTNNYVAVLDDDQHFITVLDLETMTFMKKFRGFEKVPTEDGDYDEHEVEALAIHPDETHLAYTTMFTSEIVFADFNGNKLKSIPADDEKSFRSLDFTPDGRHIFVHDGNKLLFFNTASLEEIDVLEHSKDLIAAKTRDMKTVVTVAEDSNLRIWDRTKQKQTVKESEQNNLSQAIPNVGRLLHLPSSRYIFVDGKKSKNDTDKICGVYDIIKEKFVKLRTLAGVDGLKGYTINERKVIFAISRKLYVFNLDTMAVEVTLQGFMDKCRKDVLVTSRNQLIAVTKGQKNLKVYDLSTGKVVCILKAGQKMDIESFVVNKTGTLVCANTDEGPLLLFDIAGQRLLYTIPAKPGYSDFIGFHKLINSDGTRLLFSTDLPLPGLPQGDDVDHLIVWDIQNKKELFRLYDIAYEKKYKAMKSDQSTSVDDVFELDNQRILTTSYDNILRIYDLNTGKLLNRLEGHTTSVKVDLNEKAPYILTYGCFNEEDCVRIWDKNTCAQIATFSLDKSISDVRWSWCGRFIYSITTLGTPEMVRWNIHYGHPYVSDIDFDAIEGTFSTKVDSEPLKIDFPDYKHKVVYEEGDPDTDPEIPSDDDDDDDDDDA
ncbi:NACHT domain- and WD repeat-containing protein 1-like [Mercenaria mercenaria]|uniref:NACHT domain- and WD repeat-containing protein 1-like n=1 Tax=Mercenaria mercenaria TaxID=6596 RepID=UPI00234F69C5|nr:NACHT domain- and WD repeat-containing protein 1-like [Mercenaria mercenaria]